MLPEFIYCYILRPWPLRDITNWIIKRLLPIKVKIPSVPNYIIENAEQLLIGKCKDCIS